MSAPPQLSIPGAENRWDELHWNHIVQANYIHDVVSLSFRDTPYNL